MNSQPFFDRGFGAAAPWLDLVNSELWDGFGHFTECLDDPRWVHSFIRHWKLGIPADNPTALKALHDLRGLLRSLVEKDSVKKPLSTKDMAELNAWLKVPVFPRLVESQSGFALKLLPAQIGWRSAVASIARAFADSLIQEARWHLKICANADCRWVFVDRTKGNVRRWCSDATCGNRDRVRRARASQHQAGRKSLAT
jgi:predicted RNA-binding Zn ribbon-like protein